MLPLTPGQQLKLRHGDNSVTATLIGIEESNLTLSMEDAISLERGAELELARDNALYMLQAHLEGTCTGKVCAVELLGEPSRRERRLSPRIPTNLKARYYKLFERSGARQCLQGEILDISSRGALLNTDELLQGGSDVMRNEPLLQQER